MTRMKIAPLSRAEAWWLRGFLRYAAEVVSAQEPLRDYELNAGLEVGRRALHEYDQRSLARRWTPPRRPVAGESSMTAWKNHMQAFIEARRLLPETQATAADRKARVAPAEQRP